MFNKFNISLQDYQNRKPFPHMFMDDFLDLNFAKELQAVILSIPNTDFDRYDNPFEQKYTLRDKYNYPIILQKLMTELTAENFVDKLSDLVGYQLLNDPDRNFWGVHKYKNGDKLDIHVDAGVHPKTNLKKQITLGIYLSYNWDPSYGCELELWSGDNAKYDDSKIHNCVVKIEPIFNRLVIFTCDDYSWHGNPNPCVCDDESATRIFVTISYLSNNTNFENKRSKALFALHPTDQEKNKLRLLRANPNKCQEVYRHNLS